jgi:hypothetical protein
MKLKSSRWWFLILLAFGCNEDHIVFRATSDYFPLRVGDYWRYQDTLGINPRFVEVAGDSAVAGRACIVVEDNFKETYWTKSEGRIEKFVVETVTLYGEVDTLEQNYRLFYLVPFVVGNRWGDTLTDTVVALTDTIVFSHAIDVTVAGIEDVGDFTDVYKLEIFETITQNDSMETIATTEWFAPTIGLVKRVQGGSEEVLVEYRVK